MVLNYFIKKNVIKLKREQIMKKFIIMISLTLILHKPWAISSPQLMWDDPKTGDFQVGFKTIFTHDLTRPSIPYTDWRGNIYPGKEQKGRQFQINVWYPANQIPGVNELSFGHYISLLSQQINFKPPSKESRHFYDSEFLKKIKILSGNDILSHDQLNLIKGLKTNAILNAPALPNHQFPLLIFPNNGSPAFQSVMSEFFASHGYIVVSAALKGGHGFTEDISSEGLQIAVDDIDFILNKALSLEQVDHQKICLIGNAITSSQILAYQAQRALVDCIISLDGGILSRFEQNLLKGLPYYKPENINKPILAIFAPHPAINTEHIAHLKFADRYFVHFPEMSEFYFLNFGPLEKFIPNILGNGKKNVSKGHATATNIMLTFLNGILKDQPEKLTVLKNESMIDLPHIDSLRFLPGLASPPSVTKLKDVFLKGGFAALKQEYDSLKTSHQQPFNMQTFVALKDWLAWEIDPEYKNRYQLYALAVDSFPRSTRVYIDYGHFAEKTGHMNESQIIYKKALLNLPKDPSPELSMKRANDYKKYLKSKIKSDST